MFTTDQMTCPAPQVQPGSIHSNTEATQQTPVVTQRGRVGSVVNAPCDMQSSWKVKLIKGWWQKGVWKHKCTTCFGKRKRLKMAYAWVVPKHIHTYKVRTEPEMIPETMYWALCLQPGVKPSWSGSRVMTSGAKASLTILAPTIVMNKCPQWHHMGPALASLTRGLFHVTRKHWCSKSGITWPFGTEYSLVRCYRNDGGSPDKQEPAWWLLAGQRAVGMLQVTLTDFTVPACWLQCPVRLPDHRCCTVLSRLLFPTFLRLGKAERRHDERENTYAYTHNAVKCTL